MYLDRLFPGFSLVALGYFRMIRDSEMEIEDRIEKAVTKACGKVPVA